MLLSVAERTSNSFFTIEGEGVRIASDGSISVDAGASGPVKLTARSGWLVNGRESVTYRSARGLSSGLILTSKLGEDHSCSPPPPTEKEEHITNFVFSVESNPTNLIAMYALPSTSAVVTAMAHDVLLEAGRHKVMKIWEAWECSVCGAKQEARTNVSERATAPDAWTWAATAAGRTFPTNVWSGPMSKGLGQKIEFTATGRWSPCSQCKYTTNAVVHADVHELSIKRPDYLGLDRTDAELSGRAVTNATARIDPEPASATYNWTKCGKCQFVGATDEQKVTYGITNSATASTKFLAEELKITATAKNADGLSASATCTTNFTVVAVDVTIGSVGEDKEEKEGAFVQHVPDTNGVISVEGTNKMVEVKFTCNPTNLPANEMVTVLHTGQGELYEVLQSGELLKVTSATYPACEIASRKFKLHGHAASATLTNGAITIEHANSGAKDLAKYTDVKLRVTNIKFNHDHSASAEDAINIRRSYKEPIDVTNGEWIDTGSSVTNEPFCYTTNHTVTIKARIEASGFITSAVVRASCSGAKGSLSDVLETNVVFVGGVSSPEYVTFALKDKTLSAIDCSRGGVLKWSASKVNGIAGSSCKMNETGPHTVYTIFSEPVAPWNNAFDDKRNAWTNALELACKWATGIQNREDSSAAVATAINESTVFVYDTVDGASNYCRGDLNLTKCIERLNGGIGLGNKVNCVDCASFVVAFANVLGCELYSSRMGAHFGTNPFTAIGCQSWTPPSWGWRFSFHQVAWSGNCDDRDMVFDACLRINGAGTPSSTPRTEKMPVKMMFSDGYEGAPYVYRESLAAPGIDGYDKCRATPSAKCRPDIR